MKSFGFEEELYRLPILHTLVEIFEQWLLCLVWTGGVTEIIEEEQFRTAVSLEELHLTVQSFLWLVNWLGIFLLQSLVLRALRLPILRVHVDDAEDMAVTHC